MATDRTQVGAWIGFEAVQALLAIGAQPAIERATRVAPLAAIWMLVDLVGECADDRSAFGGTEPRSDSFGNDAIPKQGDGVGGRGGHGPGPPDGDARIQSAARTAAQGEIVWVPSARPPLIALQNDHTLPQPIRTPNRASARCQARRSTSSAARSPLLRTSTGVPASVTAR